MTIGPVEYAVFAFPGNRFTGEIAPALAELVDAGTIRIIDIAFVIKDALVNAGGELWDFERVPAEVVQAAIDFAASNE